MHPTYQRLLALDAYLAKHDFPAMSDFWRETYARAYESKKRQVVLRVGRRGGKSSNLCKLAVAEALYGEHKIPAGDVGVVAIVSATTTDAKARLRTIGKMLQALGIPHTQRKEDIILDGRPIEFRVYAATVAATSGFTSILVICDEVAKWRDESTGANPAEEIINSLRPTVATMPNAKIVLSSSPLSTTDLHYSEFERGDTDYQMVAYAPTWCANPTLTEEYTRTLAPDPRFWRREYAAIPQAAVAAAFDASAIDRAFGPYDRGDREPAKRVLIVDPSSGRKDAFTWCVAGWDVQPPSQLQQDLTRIYGHPLDIPSTRPKLAPMLRVDAIGGVEGSFWDHADPDKIVDRFVAMARAHDATHVIGDQREELLLRAAVRKRGLKFTSLPWSNSTKVAGVESIRRWLASGQLALPDHEKLRRELHGFEEHVTAAGAFTFGARGSGHDDYVALLITAAMADAAGHLPSSPHKKQPPRGVATYPILPF